MPASMIAALATSAAVWGVRPGWGVVQHRLSRWRWPRFSARHVVFLAVLITIAVSSIVTLPKAVLGVAGVVVARTAFVQLTRHRERQARERARAQMLEALESLAANLRSGADPVAALGRLAHEFPAMRTVHEAAAAHAQVTQAWRNLAQAPGHEMLRDVGTAWTVALKSGAPLASVLEHVISDARREREIDREIQTAVAPARSTALLMAVLPVVALSLGSTLGGSPVTTITTSLLGALSVTVGVVLAAAGVLWVDRLVAKVERPW